MIIVRFAEPGFDFWLFFHFFQQARQLAEIRASRSQRWRFCAAALAARKRARRICGLSAIQGDGRWLKLFIPFLPLKATTQRARTFQFMREHHAAFRGNSSRAFRLPEGGALHNIGESQRNSIAGDLVVRNSSPTMPDS